MERIICDMYVKGEKHIWSADKDDWSSQEFNRKILAVNKMYGWLYEKGILQEAAFEIRDYSDVTYFALDVKDLAPYREAMEKAGVLDAEIAIQHIFDEEYTPCEYCGAIELGWTMRGYRDFDGTVSRSWECGLVKHLNTGHVLDVEEVKEKEGVRAAVSLVFELSGFYPSDISKRGELMVVKPLEENVRDIVEKLDDMSGNHLSDMLDDNEDYAWGLFVGERLVGYCSIGNAERHVDDGEGNGYPKCTVDSLLLGDVFVEPSYRELGCGAYLVDRAVRLRTEQDKQRVFLVVMDDKLCDFYQKIGFHLVGDGVMMRDERDLHKIKMEDDFEKAFAYFSEKDLDMANNRDYLFVHAEKLIYCFEADESLDMMDVDCWARYEELLGEPLSHDEYRAVNSVLDGDPYDIGENDAEKISFLRVALEGYRKEGYTWEPRTILSLIEDAVLRASDLQPVDLLEDGDLEYEDEAEDEEFEYGPW